MEEKEKQEMKRKIIEIIEKINDQKLLESIFWFAKTTLDKFGK